MWRGDVLRGGCGYRPAPRTLPESARFCEAWIKMPASARERSGRPRGRPGSAGLPGEPREQARVVLGPGAPGRAGPVSDERHVRARPGGGVDVEDRDVPGI